MPSAIRNAVLGNPESPTHKPSRQGVVDAVEAIETDVTAAETLLIESQSLRDDIITAANLSVPTVIAETYAQAAALTLNANDIVYILADENASGYRTARVSNGTILGSPYYLEIFLEVGSLAELTAGDAIVSSIRVSNRSVSNDNGGGIFIWTPGDQSTGVTADPQQGVYAAPDSDVTGVSGAWVRQLSGLYILPQWFGADTNTADNRVACQAALDWTANNDLYYQGQDIAFPITTVVAVDNPESTGTINVGIVFLEGKTTKTRDLAFDFSGLPTGSTGIACFGAQYGTAYSLTIDATGPDDNFKVSTGDSAILSDDDWVLIKSDGAWDNSSALQTEYAQIESRDTGTGICTIHGFLKGVYATSDAARVYICDKDTKYIMRGKTRLIGGGDASQHSLFQAARVIDCIDEGFNFLNGGRRGFKGLNIIKCVGGNDYAENINEDGWGYVRAYVGQYYCSVGRIDAHNCRHAITQGRTASAVAPEGSVVSRGLKVGIVTGTNYRDAVLDTHTGCTDWYYAGANATMKYGNGSDDFATFESVNGYCGPLVCVNGMRSTLLVLNEGNGDFAATNWLTIASINGYQRAVETQPAITINNLDVNNNKKLRISIGSLKGDYQRLALITPTNGDVDLHIGHCSVLIGDNQGLETVASGTYQANVTIDRADIKHNNVGSSVHAIYAKGSSWVRITSGKIENSAGSPLRCADSAQISLGCAEALEVVPFSGFKITAGTANVYRDDSSVATS